MQVATRTAPMTFSADMRLLAKGFFGLQFLVGYEWLMSGLSKALAGNFASGLAGTLADMTKDQTGWYKSFVDGLAIPNGTLFGYLVMAGEVSVGLVLIATALAAIGAWTRLDLRLRTGLLGLVAGAALIGTFMSLNFHLAMGATAPWAISPDPNDQGVDLDSLMMIMQVVLASASIGAIVWLRRAAGDVSQS